MPLQRAVAWYVFGRPRVGMNYLGRSRTVENKLKTSILVRF
jgi:hypothetical protein